jgi:hypothetical protein
VGVNTGFLYFENRLCKLYDGAMIREKWKRERDRYCHSPEAAGTLTEWIISGTHNIHR